MWRSLGIRVAFEKSSAECLEHLYRDKKWAAGGCAERLSFETGAERQVWNCEERPELRPLLWESSAHHCCAELGSWVRSAGQWCGEGGAEDRAAGRRRVGGEEEASMECRCLGMEGVGEGRLGASWEPSGRA